MGGKESAISPPPSLLTGEVAAKPSEGAQGRAHHATPLNPARLPRHKPAMDIASAPIRDPRYAARRLDVERRDDGSVLLHNPTPVASAWTTTLDALDHWAAAAPDRTWLGERSGDGWRTVTFAEARERVARPGGRA